MLRHARELRAEITALDETLQAEIKSVAEAIEQAKLKGRCRFTALSTDLCELLRAKGYGVTRFPIPEGGEYWIVSW